MTHRYLGWSRTHSGAAVAGPVHYNLLVPPGWRGHCCYCRRCLAVADWKAGEIAAAGYGDPWHCLCMSHLKAGGNEYQDALRALARAVAGK